MGIVNLNGYQDNMIITKTADQPMTEPHLLNTTNNEGKVRCLAVFVFN